jgi:hypothetical protein
MAVKFTSHFALNVTRSNDNDVLTGHAIRSTALEGTSDKAKEPNRWPLASVPLLARLLDVLGFPGAGITTISLRLRDELPRPRIPADRLGFCAHRYTSGEMALHFRA